MTTEKPFSGLLGGVAEHIVQHIVDFLIGCDVIFVNDLIAVVPSGVRLHLLPEHIIEHTADFFVGGYPFIRDSALRPFTEQIAVAACARLRYGDCLLDVPAECGLLDRALGKADSGDIELTGLQSFRRDVKSYAILNPDRLPLLTGTVLEHGDDIVAGPALIKRKNSLNDTGAVRY